MIGWWYWCWWQWYSKLYWDDPVIAAFAIEPATDPLEPPVEAEAAVPPVEEQSVVVFTAEEWARLEFMRRLVEQGVVTR